MLRGVVTSRPRTEKAHFKDWDLPRQPPLGFSGDFYQRSRPLRRLRAVPSGRVGRVFRGPFVSPEDTQRFRLLARPSSGMSCFPLSLVAGPTRSLQARRVEGAPQGIVRGNPATFALKDSNRMIPRSAERTKRSRNLLACRGTFQYNQAVGEAGIPERLLRGRPARPTAMVTHLGGTATRALPTAARHLAFGRCYAEFFRARLRASRYGGT